MPNGGSVRKEWPDRLVLEIVPHAKCQFILVVLIERELAAGPVVVLQADAKQAATLVGAPCPSGLRVDVAAKAQLFTQMSIDGKERRPRTA